MNRIMMVITLMLLCGISTMAGNYNYPITSGTLAFPGAEGFGKYTQGGRGGDVFYVTRNDDCSNENLVPGTLRWALNNDNGGRPRTVLFATSGVIYLTSKLDLKYPDVSILGQSAPGGGITLSGYKLYVCKDNVIIRYIRFRAGDAIDTNQTSLDVENCKNVIIDHCSMTWSMEECMTLYDCDYTTVQYCIIGEGLYNSKHDKGARAYAMQWGGEHATLHHCLVTNSVNRTPLFNGVRSKSGKRGDHDYQSDSEYVNNVIFNFGKINSSHGGANYGNAPQSEAAFIPTLEGYDAPYCRLAAVNNYYIPGPATAANPFMVYADKWAGEYFLSGNEYSTAAGITVQEFGHEDDTYTLLNAQPASTQSGMTYETAAASKATTLANAGARLPRLDEVDTRLIAEAKGDIAPQAKASYSKAGIIDAPSDIKLKNGNTVYAVNGIAYTDYPASWQEGDKYMASLPANGIPAGCPAANLEDYLNGLVDGTYNNADYATADHIAGFVKVTLPAAKPTKPSDDQYEYTFFGYEVAGKVYEGSGYDVYAPEGTEPKAVYTAEPKKTTFPKHTATEGTFVAEWTLDGQFTDDYSANTLTYSDVFSMDDMKAVLGSNLTYAGLDSRQGIKFTKIGNNSETKSPKDVNNAIAITFVPASSTITYRLDGVECFFAGCGSGDPRMEIAQKIGDNEDNLAVAYGGADATTGYIKCKKSSELTAGGAMTEAFASAVPQSVGDYIATPQTIYIYLYNFLSTKQADISDLKVKFSWKDSNPSAGINNVVAPSAASPVKMIKNGRVVIIKNGKQYNTVGQSL